MASMMALRSGSLASESLSRRPSSAEISLSVFFLVTFLVLSFTVLDNLLVRDFRVDLYDCLVQKHVRAFDALGVHLNQQLDESFRDSAACLQDGCAPALRITPLTEPQSAFDGRL